MTQVKGTRHFWILDFMLFPPKLHGQSGFTCLQCLQYHEDRGELCGRFSEIVGIDGVALLLGKMVEKTKIIIQ